MEVSPAKRAIGLGPQRGTYFQWYFIYILYAFVLATATQQEADTEMSTEPLNKSSQPTSSAQPAPTETASTPKEKETAVEKSKESVTVSIFCLLVACFCVESEFVTLCKVLHDCFLFRTLF